MEPRQTAIHEAGHVVAALDLGLGVASVDVVPDEDDGRLGLTTLNEDLLEVLADLHFDAAPTDEQFVLMVNLAAQAWAGSVAEEHAGYGQNSDGFGITKTIEIDGHEIELEHGFVTEGGDLQSLIRSAEIVCRGGGAEIDAFIEWARCRAEGIVIGRWDWVEIVADALVERQRLSGGEIFDLLFTQRSHGVFGKSRGAS